jgi:hypothetical protein
MRNDVLLSTVALCALMLTACGQTTPIASKAERATPTAVTAAPNGASSLQVATQGTVAAGKPVTLTLSLKDSAGAPLTTDKIAVSHTMKVHVMIVDGGLEDYTHTHAEPGSNPGEWTVSFTPKFARSYKVWTDFKLASEVSDGQMDHAKMDHDMGAKDGHSHDHDMASMPGMAGMGPMAPAPSADLIVGTQPAPAIAPIQSLSGSADGLNFSISLGGPVRVGDNVIATLAIMDPASGQPFLGLEPIMGAYGHLVGFSGDGSTMVHAHPSGEEPKDDSARGGPTLAFDLSPTVAGPARLFLQVKKGGKVITVPFTLVVSP